MKTIALVTILLAAQGLFAKATDCSDYEKFSDVPPQEMAKLVKTKSATIIDVNTKESFQKSAIPGSIHYASNAEKMSEVLPKDKNALVVAYCGGKLCTAWQKAAKAACEMGYTNVRHFSAGIKGWNKMTKKM